MIASLPAAGAGAQLGAELGLLGGPFAEFTVPAGALIGGVAGGMVGQKPISAAQAWVLSKNPAMAKALGMSPADVAAAQRAHPEWFAAGSFAPALLTGRPGSLREIAGGATLGGALEASRQALTGQSDPTQLALATVAGGAASRPYVAPPLPSPTVAPAPRTRLQRQLSTRVNQNTPDTGQTAQQTASGLAAAGVEPRPIDLAPVADVVRDAAARSRVANQRTRAWGRSTMAETPTATRDLVGQLGASDPRTGADVRADIEALATPPETLVPNVEFGKAGADIQQRMVEQRSAGEEKWRTSYDNVKKDEDPELIQYEGSSQTSAPNNMGDLARMLRASAEGYSSKLGAKAGAAAETFKRIDLLGGIPNPTMTDLFDGVKAFTQLASDNYDPQTGRYNAEGGAASAAKDQLLNAIDSLFNADRFAGSPDGIKRWNDARKDRADFGSTWESGGVQQQLTAQNSKNERLVAPEDAENIIFGSKPGSPITQRPDLARSLDVIRDTVDPDLFRSLQLAGQKRVLAPEPGVVNLGNYRDLRYTAAPVADRLFTSDDAAPLETALGNQEQARSLQAAHDLGDNFANTDAATFNTALSRMLPTERSVAQIAARQSLLDAAAKGTDGAVSTLDMIGTPNRNLNAQNNLSALFPDEYGNVQTGAEALYNRHQTASDLADVAFSPPRIPLATVGEVAALAAAPFTHGLTLVGLAPRVGRALDVLPSTMSDRTAQRVTEEAISPSATDDVLQHLIDTYGAQRSAQYGRAVNLGVLTGRTLGMVSAAPNAPPEDRKDETTPAAPKQTLSNEDVGLSFDTPSAGSSVSDLPPEQALALTAAGEASNNPAEMQAVIHTVLNRQKRGRFGPDLPSILTPSAYNVWKDPDSLVKNYAGTPKYQQALQLAQQAIAGKLPDNTNGAVYYYAPEALAKLHVSNPKTYPNLIPTFAKGREDQGTTIGSSRFYGPLPSDLPQSTDTDTDQD